MSKIALFLIVLVTSVISLLPQQAIPIGNVGGGGSSGPTLDHVATVGCAAACAGSPQTLSVSFNPTAGTHIIVEGSWCGNSGCNAAIATTDLTGGGGGISDGSNTFLNKYIDVTTGAGAVGLFLYEVVSATGGTHPITLTFNSTLTTVNYGNLMVHSVAGLAAGDAYDAHGAAFGTSTNGSCATAGNLSQSNEWIVGFENTNNLPSQGAGFTILNQQANSNTVDEYKVGGASGSTTTATFVNTLGTWFCEVSTFEHP